MKRIIAPAVVLAALAAGGIAYVVRTRGDGGKTANTREATADGAAICEEHQVPEKDCPWCRPELVEELGMCLGHGVPEALCSQCHPALIPGFKAAKDWCAGHGLPESQCESCSPGITAKWAPPLEDPEAGDVELVDAPDLPRYARAPSPTCKNHTVRVLFASDEIGRKAGIATESAVSRDVKRTIEVGAEIEYDERRLAHLAPRLEGVVVEVKKALGDWVGEGEALAWIHASDLGKAKARFLRVLDTLAVAREKVASAEDSWSRQTKMEVRLAALDFLEASELLEVARQDQEREERLMAQEATSEKDVLEARAAFLSARARKETLAGKLRLFGLLPETLEGLTRERVDSLEGFRGTTPEKDLLEARIEEKAATAELTDARNDLRVLGFTKEEIETIAREKDTTSLLSVSSPLAGEIVQWHAVVGEVAGTSEALFTIADTSKMWGRLDLLGEDIARVRVGQPAVFSFDLAPGETFGGRLAWVASRIDRETRALAARVELENRDHLLKDGMFGTALIEIGVRSGVVVPRSAVQWEGCCNLVFIKRNERLYEPRKVKVAFEAGDSYVLERGVTAGEPVVTTGSFLLKTEILKGSIGAGCCEFD